MNTIFTQGTRGSNPFDGRPHCGISAVRQSWRETVILSRAKGPVRNRTSYLRAAMPTFVANEKFEIAQWLVSQLAREIQAHHPSIDRMKAFVERLTTENDLPRDAEMIEPVIELAYFKWKSLLPDFVR